MPEPRCGKEDQSKAIICEGRAMKLRKHKKLLYANVKNNRPFSYYVNDVMMTIAKAAQKMSQALHDVYRGKA
jgi:hypothetical protein